MTDAYAVCNRLSRRRKTGAVRCRLFAWIVSAEYAKLLNTAEFRDVVSGRRQGPAGAVLRGLLRLAEGPYAWVMRRRNRAFDAGGRGVHRVGAPVVSVGNITLGGTGKTPMVEWLARWFRDRGIPVALVSRGYKATGQAKNDEARELEQRLPDVPHLQNPDRVAAAREAVDRLKCRVVVLDDGFQHRRLARDLDIVLIDALEPFGFGHVFPRGTLREPIEGLARANVVALTRADLVDALERARIRSIVERHAPQATWLECRHAPRRLLSAAGNEFPLSALAGRRVAAFCGIGNPVGFRRTLDDCRCEIIVWREYPDHHQYRAADLEALGRWAVAHDVAMIVCTQKDLVKIDVDSLGDIPLRALGVEMEIVAGQQALEQRLDAIMTAHAAR